MKLPGKSVEWKVDDLFVAVYDSIRDSVHWSGRDSVNTSVQWPVSDIIDVISKSVEDSLDKQ
jgi:hypothetical protein